MKTIRLFFLAVAGFWPFLSHSVGPFFEIPLHFNLSSNGTKFGNQVCLWTPSRDPNQCNLDEWSKKQECGAEGTLEIKNNPWSITFKKGCTGASRWLETFKYWANEDKKNNRLFRPFVFHDVMGFIENDFRAIWKSKKYLFPVLHYLYKEYKKSGNADLSAKKLTADTKLFDPIQGFPGRKNLFGQPFFLKTIGELREEYKKGKQVSRKPKKPKHIIVLDAFKILHGDKKYLAFLNNDLFKGEAIKGGLYDALKYTDIRFLQEHFEGAAFQIASTKTCLEGGSEEGTLESMQFSPVQGENASLGGMGAAIIRKYAVPLEKRKLFKNFTSIAALKERDIENIAVGIHQDVLVTSGYYTPYIQINEIGSLNDLKKINQGINEDISLKNDKKLDPGTLLLDGCSCFRKEFLFKGGIVKNNRNPVYMYNSLPKKTIRIDQIFNAALNLDKRAREGSAESAKTVLKAMYEGTLLAAALRGKQKVFLTLLGCGAFKNDVNWVLDALSSDRCKKIIAETGMQVVLVVFYDIRREVYKTANPTVYKGISKINTYLTKRALSMTSKKNVALEKLAESLQVLAQ